MSPRCRLFLSDVQRVEVIGRYYLHAFANSAGESVEQIVQDDANALKTLRRSVFVRSTRNGIQAGRIVNRESHSG